jgi:lipopolysaccharide export system protein LptC
MDPAKEPRLALTSIAKGDMPELVAPRRVFKRKNRRGLVLGLKIGLPLIALAGATYVVIWSRTHNSTITPLDFTKDVAKQTSDVKVSRVKYDGVDAQNRPFSITADSAVQPQDAPPPPKPVAGLGGDDKAPAPSTTQQQQPAANANLINLQKPLADMTMRDGAWVAVQADSGVYDRDAGTVDLHGNVMLFHDTGLTFETDAAKVDLRNDTASGDQPVEGSRPDGELAAEGFEVRNGGQTVIFTGRAYMKLYPKPKSSAAD